MNPREGRRTRSHAEVRLHKALPGFCLGGRRTRVRLRLYEDTMTCISTLDLHLCFSLQADQAEYSEDQPNQNYNQIYDPHGVLLLLKRTGTTGRKDPLLAGEPDNHTGKQV